MAVSEKEFRELSNSVAGIKGSLKTWQTVAKIVISVVGLAALSIGAWCWHIGNKVTAIEQQLADGGNTKLVTELKAPKSQEQLRANLSTVNAQILTARANGTKPDMKKVQNLSGALAQVVQTNPQLPEGWQVGSQLISYRTSQSVSAAKDCIPPIPPNIPLTSKTLGIEFEVTPPPIAFSDCTLDLDDMEHLKDYAMSKGAQIEGRRYTHVAPPNRIWINLLLTRVHVIYKGGDLSAIRSILFQYCTFDWQVNEAPKNKGAKITESLLASNNLQSVIIDFTAGI